MHIPVLLQESVDALLFDRRRGETAPQVLSEAVYVDGTFGRGGHSRALLARLPKHAKLIAFDRDPAAIEAAATINDPRFEIIHAPFSDLNEALAGRGVANIAGALFDLGVSSPQLDEAERGFSFMRDGPLDMRMDSSRGETASQWLARIDETTLTEAIRDYGEDRFARAIARAIVAARSALPHGEIQRTIELAEIVSQAVRTRERGQHPATRTFQAIRIALNRELDEITVMLQAASARLAPGARLAVISFHSLEDRLVKQFFQRAANPESAMDIALKKMPIPAAQLPKAQFALVGKSIVASEAELKNNPRARSARLRVLEKLQ
jgi:16S rRNA (cytosine1402-N4)-methyltransferase